MFVLLAFSLSAVQPQARAGYPKLFRCQSAIQRPEPLPSFSPGCIDFRERELARIQALPLPQRRERVAALREAIGVQPGEGLELAPDGSFRPAGEPDRTR